MINIECESTITKEFVRSILDYDPITGIFTWKWVDGARLCDNRRRAGRVAGSIDGAGYIHIRIGKFRPKSHRLAWLWMTGEWPPEQVDHKNRKRAENWWDNLRLATNQENQINSTTRIDNTSGFKGVQFDAKCTIRPWIAIDQSCGRLRKLGYFRTPEEAHERLTQERIKNFGEYARVS